MPCVCRLVNGCRTKELQAFGHIEHVSTSRNCLLASSDGLLASQNIAMLSLPNEVFKFKGRGNPMAKCLYGVWSSLSKGECVSKNSTNLIANPANYSSFLESSCEQLLLGWGFDDSCASNLHLQSPPQKKKHTNLNSGDANWSFDLQNMILSQKRKKLTIKNQKTQSHFWKEQTSTTTAIACARAPKGPVLGTHGAEPPGRDSTVFCRDQDMTRLPCQKKYVYYIYIYICVWELFLSWNILHASC